MICAVFPLGLLAQQRTEYNRKGDEAMKRLDYSDAKMWYEEGVSQCDAYSIDQLTIEFGFPTSECGLPCVA